MGISLDVAPRTSPMSFVLKGIRYRGSLSAGAILYFDTFNRSQTQRLADIGERSMTVTDSVPFP